MKILAFAQYNSGVSLHRIINPLMLMKGAQVFITNQFKEEDFPDVDIVLYNRNLPMQVMNEINRLRETFGFKLCLDMDDHWELDSHHILYDKETEAESIKSQIWHLENADIVTCTHDRLALAIAEYNKNVHILPNAIPKADQFDIERIASPFTRLFWQGSITHAEDIELLAGPIQAIAPIASKVKMIMAGYSESADKAANEAWHRITHAYTAGYKHQYKIIPALHSTQYYTAYMQADVCLIPLVNSPFNKMKSNLKVLEAANLGLPVICSQVHPYMDLPVCYARSSSDWVSNIKRFVASKKRQKEAGAELKAFIDQHYNFEKINRERKQIFEFETTVAN